jgi:hypothetical protein
MAVDGEGDGRQIAFRTNVDDLVPVGPEHPLRFDTDAGGGVRPYVRVRGGLWARLTRSLALDLIALGEERGSTFGIAVAGTFVPIGAGADADRPA